MVPLFAMCCLSFVRLMGALIVIDVHARDAVSDLINKGTWGDCLLSTTILSESGGACPVLSQPACSTIVCAVCAPSAADVSSLDDFEWTRQLRYYWEDAIGRPAAGALALPCRCRHTVFPPH